MQSYVIHLWFRRKPVAENKPNPAPWPPRCPPSMTPCKQRGHPNTSAGTCVSPQRHPSHPRLCKTPLNNHFYRCLSCPLCSDRKKVQRPSLRLMRLTFCIRNLVRIPAGLPAQALPHLPHPVCCFTRPTEPSPKSR